MGKKLYIGNLSFDISDEELEEAFAKFGEIASTTIIKDSVSGRSKGFGFIEFAQEESAKKAAEEMNGKELAGRTLKVDEAREQRERGPRQQRPRNSNFRSRERY